MKKVLAVFAMTFIVVAVSVFSISAEDGLTTEYRYKEKEFSYHTSKELSSPWILIDTHTHILHNNYQKIYIEYHNSNGINTLDAWLERNEHRYCIHGYDSAYRYVKYDSSYNIVDEVYFSSGDTREIEKYKKLGYSKSGGSYCAITYCTERISYYTYDYYKWGEWSEWSEAPVTATDDRIVETREVVSTYDIKYNANGGSGAPNTQIKTHDEDILLSTVVPTKNGYTFMGWSTSTEGTPIYTSGDVFFANGDTTLFAIWTVAGGTCGDGVTWMLLDEKTLAIYGEGAMYDYSSSSSAPWYNYISSISSVVVEDGVTSIGRLAFANCSSLVSAYLADSVKTIGMTAFMNSASLEKVVLYNVESIGKMAFSGCKNLTVYGLAGAVEETYTSENSIAFVGHTHTEVDDIRSATCVSDGLQTVYCNSCERLLSETVLPMLGHDYVDHDAKAATCIEIGYDAYQTCSRCDYTTYAEIPALGHDYVDHDAKAATCTEVGYDAYQNCSRCDYTSYAEIPALGHDYIDNEAKAATCTEIGWNAYQTCSRCDFTTYAEIAALGHDEEETIMTEPTMDAPGLAMYTCKACPYIEYRDLPQIVFDIDGDGNVGVTDVLFSLKSFLNGEPLNDADMNDDGKFTLIDILRILKLIVA